MFTSKINTIYVPNFEGYFSCRSKFFTANICTRVATSYRFNRGVNILFGDIDSGDWGISYAMSMSKYDKNIILNGNGGLFVDGKEYNISEVADISCYMDEKYYPLFSSSTSVKALIEQGIENSLLNISSEEIKQKFGIEDHHYVKPLIGVGTRVFRCMAAIGYAHQKSIFCFPWISDRFFHYYQRNISDVLEVLKNENKIVILPTNFQINN